MNLGLAQPIIVALLIMGFTSAADSAMSCLDVHSSHSEKTPNRIEAEQRLTRYFERFPQEIRHLILQKIEQGRLSLGTVEFLFRQMGTERKGDRQGWYDLSLALNEGAYTHPDSILNLQSRDGNLINADALPSGLSLRVLNQGEFAALSEKRKDPFLFPVHESTRPTLLSTDRRIIVPDLSNCIGLFIFNFMTGRMLVGHSSVGYSEILFEDLARLGRGKKFALIIRGALSGQDQQNLLKRNFDIPSQVIQAPGRFSPSSHTTIWYHPPADSGEAFLMLSFFYEGHGYVVKVPIRPPPDEDRRIRPVGP